LPAQLSSFRLAQRKPANTDASRLSAAAGIRAITADIIPAAILSLIQIAARWLTK